MMTVFNATGVADTTTAVYPLLSFVWPGIVIVYLFFGGIWLIRGFNKETAGGFQ